MMGYFGCENLIILTDSDYPSLTWGWNISGYYKMRLLAKKYYQNLGEKWTSHRFLRDISDHIRYLG